ncbi:MAG TPA: VOC family protein [Tepidiformaceae bacterium]|nr:VOC family protein [Tepidiformaceae bacterium]
MTTGIKTVIYPVKDLGQAKQIFRGLLGLEPYADQPYYVGFKVDGQDIGLDPNGHQSGMTGPVGYFHVEDIQASMQALRELGAEVQQDARDVGGGRLVATMRDADGNAIGLIQG